MTIPLLELTSTPVEMIAAGPEVTAIRGGAPGYEFLLVDLGHGGLLPIRFNRASESEAILSFLSVRGSVYRIERASRLNAAEWEAVRDNLPGSGGELREPISIGTEATAFFRVARIDPNFQ